MASTAAADLAPLVSGTSVMLAAYGFFYNAVKDRMDQALKVNDSPGTTDEGEASLETVKGAKRTAEILTAVAAAVFALLVPQVVSEVEAAIDVHFALHEYSTLDAIFVAMAAAWLGVTVFVGWRARQLRKKTNKISENLAKLKTPSA